MLGPGVGIKPEAILHTRFRSLATELEASPGAAEPDPASAAAEQAGAPGIRAPAGGAAPGAHAGAAAAERSASAAEAPHPMAVDAADAEPADAAAPAAAQRAAGGQGREEQQRRILDHILDEVIYSSRAEARSCAARLHALCHCVQAAHKAVLHMRPGALGDPGKWLAVLQAHTAGCVWLVV